MKKLLSVILSLMMILSMGVSAAAQTQAVDPHDHTETAEESQGPTGTYIKVADGVYRLDPNAPTPRYIPKPSCYDCGSTKFVTAKNAYGGRELPCPCPMYYNGHACYYCGTMYIDESWVNHKSSCDLG